MQTFATGSAVTLAFVLFDGEDKPIEPTSAVAEVHDETGTLISSTILTVTPDLTELDVVISAADNTSLVLTARAVTLVLEGPRGIFRLTQSYILRPQMMLSVPAESAQTVLQASMLTTQLPPSFIDPWGYAEEHEREAALREAWERINRVTLYPWREGETIPPQFDLMLEGKHDLRDLDIGLFNQLPSNFLHAVRRAQVVEAIIALEGDPTYDRRVDGLISKTVGESSEFFRTAKPIIEPLSPKAMREIQPFVRRRVTFVR